MNSNNGSTPGAIEFVEPPGTGGDKDQSPTTAPHLVLYCFPHAGGSPSSFRHWPGHPDFPRRGKIQVRVLSLPGRGGRFSESPWENWNSYDEGDDPVSLVSALAGAFLADWDGMTPYAFFGHSFGTLLAFELILELDRRCIQPLPLGAFMSAHRAPGCSPELGGMGQTHILPRDEFLGMIRHWGLVPDDALEDEELVDIMIHALRADLKLDETHSHPLQIRDNSNVGGRDSARDIHRSTRLPVPIVAYGAKSDQTVPVEQLELWRNVAPVESNERQLDGQSALVPVYDEVWFDGNHFYTVTHLSELLKSIGKRLHKMLGQVERSILFGGLGCDMSPPIAERVLVSDQFLVDKGLSHSKEKYQDEAESGKGTRWSNVLDLFLEQVQRTPDFVAMEDENMKKWTYSEMGETVRKFGQYLRFSFEALSPRFGENENETDLQDSRDKNLPRIGIYLHHESSYLFANLSSWYAGCSVVLLERNWTGNLLREFIEVCKVDIVITDAAGEDNLRAALFLSEDSAHRQGKHEEEGTGTRQVIPSLVVIPSGGVIDLASKSGGKELFLRQEISKDLPEPLGPRDIAFVSMTSGSTGKPSAVLTTHRGTRFCFEARYKVYPYRVTNVDEESAGEMEQEREGANVFFAWESIRPLLLGHILVIIPDRVILSPPNFVSYISERQITRLVVTPSLLDSVFAYPHVGESLRDKLSHMYGWFLMGEVVPMRLVEQAMKYFPPSLKLINAYSSWEALDVSYSDLLPLSNCQVVLGLGGSNESIESLNIVDKTPHYAPVGYPLPNVHALILDENYDPVPRGALGALHILTPALATGYIGDALKTSKRFRPMPSKVHESLLKSHPNVFLGQLGLESDHGPILFDSGDIGRVLPDGQLGLLGRGDDTVKLRGFKVGIPFVESALVGIEGVASAVVLPVLDEVTKQPDFLVAYIVGVDGKPSESVLDRVVRQARELIPPFAVPRDFVGLNQMPLRHGESRKLDKKALPIPPSLVKKRDGERSEGANVEDGLLRQFKSTVASSSNPVLPPLNRLEQVVTQAWVEVLHLDPGGGTLSKAVSREDNFFDIGGNSLLASDLIGRLSCRYGLALSVLDLYQHSTLRALIEYCQRHVSVPRMSSGSARSGTLRSRHKAFRSPSQYSGKMAIVGMSGKFPGADTISKFWENICSGKDSIRRFSDSELATHGIAPEVYKHPNWVAAGQVLDDPDKFDSSFWNISPREAELMDPQHRIFMEVAWSAMENAGYPPQSSKDKARTGVWAACGIDGYLIHHLKGGGMKKPLDPSNLFLTEVGNEKDYISTRVSYALDLGGPSMTVTSACSSGLVAIAQAAQSLMVGQTDVAIAGASSLTFPNLGYCYEEGMVGSRDGQVRPFDEKASGTLFGDGVGALVLKRLEDAVEDGDHVWCTLTGFDVTNDGRQKAGYAAPSAAAQARAVIGALDMAGISSNRLSYVECHATATHVGDGIELQGLVDAFQETASDLDEATTHNAGRCALGSVKGNIGHANCAAGISGIIKTVLMLKNRMLVPTAHFKTPNSKLARFLDPKTSPFYINQDLKHWDVANENLQLPRVAGVSSFGIGGTNAHAILEEWPMNAATEKVKERSDSCDTVLLPVSAKTREALLRNVENLTNHLEILTGGQRDSLYGYSPAPSLRSIAYTLQCGREAFQQRVCVVASSYKDAIVSLQNVAFKLSGSQESQVRTSPSSVVMCFPGQGSHYPGMARGLYEDKNQLGFVFQSHLNQICQEFRDSLGFDLIHIMFGEGDKSHDFAHPLVTQPAIFAIEYALALTLRNFGVHPVAVAGHSIGEYVAATVAGVLKLSDAVLLIGERAKATADQAIGCGTMLFVKIAPKEAKCLVKQNSDLYLAADNGPKHVVISGSTAAIDALADGLTADGIGNRKLKVTHAFHSNLLKVAATRLVECARRIEFGSPRIPLVSNVTGRWVTDEMSKPEYWGRQMTGTVRWREGVELILQWVPTAIIEVGPGSTLVSLISKCMSSSWSTSKLTVKLASTLPHARDDSTDAIIIFHKLLASLWQEGHDIDWNNAYSGHIRNGDAFRTAWAKIERVPLPSYSFEKTIHWSNPEASIYVDHKGDNKSSAVARTYQVKWQLREQIPADKERDSERSDLRMLELDTREIDFEVIKRLTSRATSEVSFVIVLKYPSEVLEKPFDPFSRAYERDIGWTFMKFAQDLVSLTSRGRIYMIVPASPLCALAVGASRSISQEYPSLIFVRVFIPVAESRYLNCSALPVLLNSNRSETDVFLPEGLRLEGRVLVQRLVPLDAYPSASSVSSYTFGGNTVSDDEDSGVYLVTGGTGALGQALIARMILNHNIPRKKIFVLTRKTQIYSDDPLFGTETIAVDCSDYKSLKECSALRAIKAVVGIFHIAGCVDDAVLLNQTKERLDRVVAPKAAITSLVTIAKERDWTPRFIVAYSSTTSLLGYPGQSNYGAANSLLDNMVTWGDNSIPLIVINWGSWDAGMAVKGTKAHEAAVRKGDVPMAAEAALEALESLLGRILVSKTSIQGQYAICGVKWESSPWHSHPILSNILTSGPSMERENGRSGIGSPSSLFDRRQAVINVVASHFSRWDPDETLAALGLDSLDILQLVRDISTSFDIDIGLQDVVQSNQTLSEFIEGISLRIHH